MTTPAFPTLPSGARLDSKKFSISLQDNTVSKSMDGGYTVSRPRTTRANRRSFKCAYTMLPEADRAVLDTFFNTVYGGSVIFTWVSPQNGITYSVRFKGALQFSYVGVNNSQYWDCAFELEQA